MFLTMNVHHYFKAFLTWVFKRYDISSNSPSGGINEMVLSLSNLDKRTHWWNFTSSRSTALLLPPKNIWKKVIVILFVRPSTRIQYLLRFNYFWTYSVIVLIKLYFFEPVQLPRLLKRIHFLSLTSNPLQSSFPSVPNLQFSFCPSIFLSRLQPRQVLPVFSWTTSASAFTDYSFMFSRPITFSENTSKIIPFSI